MCVDTSGLCERKRDDKPSKQNLTPLNHDSTCLVIACRHFWATFCKSVCVCVCKLMACGMTYSLTQSQAGWEGDRCRALQRHTVLNEHIHSATLQQSNTPQLLLNVPVLQRHSSWSLCLCYFCHSFMSFSTMNLLIDPRCFA